MEEQSEGSPLGEESAERGMNKSQIRPVDGSMLFNRNGF